MAASIQDRDAYEGELEHIRELARAIQQQIAFIRDFQDVGFRAPVWQNVGNAIRLFFSVPALENVAVTADIRNIEIYADVLLERVLSSLAVYATRPGKMVTKIWFTIIKSPSGLSLTYEDNGTGVPAALKEQIFKRGYYRNANFSLFLA